LAHVRPSDPRELPVVEAVGEELRVLVRVAERVRTLHSGPLGSVGIVGELNFSLEWSLRHFELEMVDRMPDAWFLPGAAERPALILLGPGVEAPEGYIGELFVVSRHWMPTWGGQATARWWLYRETVESPNEVDRVVLWVRDDLATPR